MILVDSFAQNYRWPMHEILDLTMPQIYMLNGAASENRRRMESKVAHNQSTHSPKREPAPNPANTWRGKPIDQLNTDEYKQYFRDTQRSMME